MSLCLCLGLAAPVCVRGAKFPFHAPHSAPERAGGELCPGDGALFALAAGALCPGLHLGGSLGGDTSEATPVFTPGSGRVGMK